MITIFPFLIDYTTIENYLNNITKTTLTSETLTIAFILINFVNIWFIIKLLELIIKTFKKIINVLF